MGFPQLTNSLFLSKLKDQLAGQGILSIISAKNYSIKIIQ
jgi:hypothetical protein